MNLIILLLALWALQARLAGGEFVNLNFDEPDLTHLGSLPITSSTIGPIDEFLRGWKVETRKLFGEWEPLVGQVEFTFSGANAGVSYAYLAFGDSLDERDLSVHLGLDEPLGGSLLEPREVRISQTGTIPVNARALISLRPVPLTVSDSNHSVTVVPRGVSYDISEFAGREVTISIYVSRGIEGTIDIKAFELIPEPDAWLLGNLGAIVLLCWQRLKSRRASAGTSSS